MDLEKEAKASFENLGTTESVSTEEEKYIVYDPRPRENAKGSQFPENGVSTHEHAHVADATTLTSHADSEPLSYDQSDFEYDQQQEEATQSDTDADDEFDFEEKPQKNVFTQMNFERQNISISTQTNPSFLFHYSKSQSAATTTSSFSLKSESKEKDENSQKHVSTITRSSGDVEFISKCEVDESQEGASCVKQGDKKGVASTMTLLRDSSASISTEDQKPIFWNSIKETVFEMASSPPKGEIFPPSELSSLTFPSLPITISTQNSKPETQFSTSTSTSGFAPAPPSSQPTPLAVTTDKLIVPTAISTDQPQILTENSEMGGEEYVVIEVDDSIVTQPSQDFPMTNGTDLMVPTEFPPLPQLFPPQGPTLSHLQQQPSLQTNTPTPIPPFCFPQLPPHIVPQPTIQPLSTLQPIPSQPQPTVQPQPITIVASQNQNQPPISTLQPQFQPISTLKTTPTLLTTSGLFSSTPIASAIFIPPNFSEKTSPKIQKKYARPINASKFYHPTTSTTPSDFHNQHQFSAQESFEGEGGEGKGDEDDDPAYYTGVFGGGHAKPKQNQQEEEEIESHNHHHHSPPPRNNNTKSGNSNSKSNNNRGAKISGGGSGSGGSVTSANANYSGGGRRKRESVEVDFRGSGGKDKVVLGPSAGTRASRRRNGNSIESEQQAAQSFENSQNSDFVDAQMGQEEEEGRWDDFHSTAFDLLSFAEFATSETSQVSGSGSGNQSQLQLQPSEPEVQVEVEVVEETTSFQPSSFGLGVDNSTMMDSQEPIALTSTSTSTPAQPSQPLQPETQLENPKPELSKNENNENNTTTKIGEILDLNLSPPKQQQENETFLLVPPPPSLSLNNDSVIENNSNSHNQFNQNSELTIEIEMECDKEAVAAREIKESVVSSGSSITAPPLPSLPLSKIPKIRNSEKKNEKLSVPGFPDDPKPFSQLSIHELIVWTMSTHFPEIETQPQPIYQKLKQEWETRNPKSKLPDFKEFCNQLGRCHYKGKIKKCGAPGSLNAEAKWLWSNTLLTPPPIISTDKSRKIEEEEKPETRKSSSQVSGSGSQASAPRASAKTPKREEKKKATTTSTLEKIENEKSKTKKTKMKIPPFEDLTDSLIHLFTNAQAPLTFLQIFEKLKEQKLCVEVPKQASLRAHLRHLARMSPEISTKIGGGNGGVGVYFLTRRKSEFFDNMEETPAGGIEPTTESKIKSKDTSATNSTEEIESESEKIVEKEEVVKSGQEYKFKNLAEAIRHSVQTSAKPLTTSQIFSKIKKEKLFEIESSNLKENDIHLIATRLARRNILKMIKSGIPANHKFSAPEHDLHNAELSITPTTTSRSIGIGVGVGETRRSTSAPNSAAATQSKSIKPKKTLVVISNKTSKTKITQISKATKRIVKKPANEKVGNFGSVVKAAASTYQGSRDIEENVESVVVDSDEHILKEKPRDWGQFSLHSVARLILASYHPQPLTAKQIHTLAKDRKLIPKTRPCNDFSVLLAALCRNNKIGRVTLSQKSSLEMSEGGRGGPKFAYFAFEKDVVAKGGIEPTTLKDEGSDGDHSTTEDDGEKMSEGEEEILSPSTEEKMSVVSDSEKEKETTKRTFTPKRKREISPLSPQLPPRPPSTLRRSARAKSPKPQKEKIQIPTSPNNSKTAKRKQSIVVVVTKKKISSSTSGSGSGSGSGKKPETNKHSQVSTSGKKILRISSAAAAAGKKEEKAENEKSGEKKRGYVKMPFHMLIGFQDLLKTHVITTNPTRKDLPTLREQRAWGFSASSQFTAILIDLDLVIAKPREGVFVKNGTCKDLWLKLLDIIEEQSKALGEPVPPCVAEGRALGKPKKSTTTTATKRAASPAPPPKPATPSRKRSHSSGPGTPSKSVSEPIASPRGPGRPPKRQKTADVSKSQSSTRR